MWPFKPKIKKEAVSIADQVAIALKSVTVPDLAPQWSLSKFNRKTWDTATAIKEGYDASAIVYTAVEKRAKLISSVPWKAMRRTGDELVHEPNSDLQKLINKPNPEQSTLELIYMASQQIDLSGDSILTKIRKTKHGEPIALWVMPSEKIEAKQGRNNIISQFKIGNNTIERKDAIHLKLPSPSDPVFGQPILMSASRPVDIDREGANWQKSGLQNRGIMDIMIKVPEGTAQTERDIVKKTWLERQAGGDNARKPLITSGDVKQFGQNAVEMDFINSRKTVWTEIAACFGIPLAAMGFTENVNLANAKEMNKSMWVDTIIPQLELIKRQLDAQLASEFGDEWVLEYDLSGVEALQTNLNEKIDAAEKLQRLGYTRNEINNKLELGFENDEDTGNIRYEPVGLIPIGEDDPSDEDDLDDEEKRKIHRLTYGSRKAS